MLVTNDIIIKNLFGIWLFLCWLLTVFFICILFTHSLDLFWLCYFHLRRSCIGSYFRIDILYKFPLTVFLFHINSLLLLIFCHFSHSPNGWFTNLEGYPIPTFSNVLKNSPKTWLHLEESGVFEQSWLTFLHSELMFLKDFSHKLFGPRYQDEKVVHLIIGIHPLFLKERARHFCEQLCRHWQSGEGVLCSKIICGHRKS